MVLSKEEVAAGLGLVFSCSLWPGNTQHDTYKFNRYRLVDVFTSVILASTSLLVIAYNNYCIARKW